MNASSARREPLSHARLSLGAIEAGIAQKLPVLDRLASARRALSGNGPGLRVLAQGDSWLDYGAGDLADCLRRDGGHAVASLAVSGSTLDDVLHGTLPAGYRGIAEAHRVSRAEDLVYAMQAQRPEAIVLSAGGNDVKNGDFLGHLGAAALSSAAFDGEAIGAEVRTRFLAPYSALVELIDAVASREGRRVPVIVHTYDYPRVSPRLQWAARQWGLDARVFESASRSYVDAFDAVLRELAAAFPGVVYRCDLRGSLTHAVDWADEIHPSPRGFAMLAEKVDAVLRAAVRSGS